MRFNRLGKLDTDALVTTGWARRNVGISGSCLVVPIMVLSLPAGMRRRTTKTLSNAFVSNSFLIVCIRIHQSRSMNVSAVLHASVSAAESDGSCWRCGTRNTQC
jgi:hypothetical protein